MAPPVDSGSGQSPPTSRLTVGRVSGVFGVSGWIKLHSYTEPRLAILDYDDYWLSDARGERPVRIVGGKAHGKGVIARFDGIDDRDAAAELIDSELAVARSSLPVLPEGRYYWADLEGLRVLHVDDTELGRVDHLLATGANDVLVVRGDKEILIPYLWGSVVLDVDLEAGTLTVDWEWD